MELFTLTQKAVIKMFSPFALYPYRRVAGSTINSTQVASMPVDVAEEEERYLVKASLPGIPTDDINVTVHDGMLTIKPRPRVRRNSRMPTIGCASAMWVPRLRRFTLPSTVDEEHVTAQYDHGVLTLSLPKTSEVQPKRIAIDKGQS